MARQPAAGKAPGLRAMAERAGLLAASVVLLLAIELGLRLVGIGAEDYAALDFGATPHQHLYGPDPQAPGMITMAPWIRHMKERNVRKLVNRTTFPARPEQGELRVFTCGESTVFGYPVGGKVAFPLHLEHLLSDRLPAARVRVINAGVPAYDSGRVRHVVEEVVAYRPHVMVLYLGHNDFIRRFALEKLETLGWRIRLRQRLARLRLYQVLTWALGPVLRREAAALDVTPALAELDKAQVLGKPRTDAETAVVVQRFRKNVRASIDAAREAGASRVVVCTVASRLQAATNRMDVLEPGERDAIRPVLAALETASRPEEVEAITHTGIGIAPHFAPLHHALGLSLEAQGRLDEARASYLRARDLETNARRGGTEINQAIRDVGRDAGATVVDIEALFLARMDRGCFGDQLFRDHCHPDWEGHTIIARAILDAVDWEAIPRGDSGRGARPRRR